MTESRKDQTDIIAEKKILRAKMLALRDAMPQAQRQRESLAVCQKLLHMPAIVQAQKLLLTLARGSELDLSPLIHARLAAALTVVVPHVTPGVPLLRLYEINMLDADLEPGPWQILQPIPERCNEVQPQAIDAVLLPGLAFTMAGKRLGYGGGYFDRLLPLIPQTAPRLAPALAVQIVDDVPMDNWDAWVDGVIIAGE